MEAPSDHKKTKHLQMKRKLIPLVVLFTGTLLNGYAQTPFMDAYAEKPLSSAQLFSLNPQQYNHHFNIALPNEGVLKIDFLRLSDWGAQNQLSKIINTAAQQAASLKDSFRSDYSVKTLELNIPINDRIVSVDYKEDDSRKNQLAYKDGDYYNLKTAFDTIRVIKNVDFREDVELDSALMQIQYTFIVKDIKDIQALADQPKVIEQLGNGIDSAIDIQRRKWKNQDAIHHKLVLDYNPDRKKPWKADDRQESFSPFIEKNIGIYVGLGATVYDNTISPYVEETIAYMVPGHGKMQGFVGLTLSAYGFLTAGEKEVKLRYATYNVEIGVCRRSPGLMQQKTSVLFGALTRYNGISNKTLFNVGVNIGLNSFLAVGFNAATNFKKGSDNNFLGIHFKFNL